jgi:integrase
MGFKKGENPHHPKHGAAIRVEPIRDLHAIAKIKDCLIREDRMRDHCLFTLGINTGWRANELLSITVGRVRGLKAGDALSMKQSKTGTYRSTPINYTAHRAIEFWLAMYDSGLSDDAPLFPSLREGSIRVPTLCNMVKHWCSMAGLRGRYGSHSLRKTWGFHQRITFDAPLSLLVKAYGHSSERQTLDYLGIQPREIDELYLHEL